MMGTFSCAACGQPIAQGQAVQTARGWLHPTCAASYGASPQYAQAPPVWMPAEQDTLSGWWLLLIYGAPVLPCVWLPVWIARLIMYSKWQTQYPMRAAALRKHGRISAVIFLAIWGTLWLVSKLQ